MTRGHADDSLHREPRFRAVFDSARDAMFVLRGETFVECNPKAIEMFGCPANQILGKSPFDFSPALQSDGRPSAEKGREIIQAALAGADQFFEWQHCRPDGTIVDAEVSLNRLDVEDPPLIMAVVRNVTARKRGQEALRTREEQLQQAVRVAGLGIFDHDQVHDTVQWSGQMSEITGCTPAGRGGLQDWIDLIHPEDREKIAEAIRRAHDPAGDGRYHVEHRILRPDGGVRWVSVQSQTFFEGQGPARRAVRTIGATLDITRHKLAEEALRRSEEKFRAIADYTYGWENWVGPDGKLLWVNPAVQRMTGYSQQEVMAMPDFPKPLILEEDWPKVRASFEKSLRGQRTDCPLEFRIQAKDGRVLWASAVAQTIFDDQGRSVGHRSSVLDITERKEAEQKLLASEAKLREANEQLEQRVRQRTAQLRLLASELTLAEYRERRRLAEMLHDNLQQLLVGAKYRLQSLEGAGDPGAKQLAEEVQGLLDQSIECSRTLTGELIPPVLYHGGLGPALEWLANWMRTKHGLNVELQVEPGAAPESEDMMVLLFQSVRELLFNAAKHARVDTAEVNLRKTDEEIVITVSDRGAGFDPQAVTPQAGKAHGFGLFNIRERLELLGGTMEIDAAPGRGSRFTLRTPYLAPAPGQPPAAEARAAGEIHVQMQLQMPNVPAVSFDAGPGGHGIRVLLVDDHVAVRQAFGHLLKEHPDIEVVAEASDGPMAVEMVRRLRPDVVTMDISLPGMDGVEATRIIHREFPDVKVVAMSMFEEGARAKAMHEAGAVDYLTKSAPSDLLVAAIRRAAAVGPAK